MKRIGWSVGSIVLVMAGLALFGLGQSTNAQETNRRLMAVYDRGVTRVFLTQEKTVADALRVEGIELDKHDTVEPVLSRVLVASDYKVNIYRARPVLIVDGPIRIKTVSSYQTAQQIAKDAGITIYDEDSTSLKPLTNFVADGAGLLLTITRSTTFTLDLYGKKTVARTQARTVGDMLVAKKISLGVNDRISVVKQTAMSAGLEVRVTREGKQTVTIDELIASPNKIVYDADQPLGYRQVRAAGVPGIRSVSYEVEIKDGVEISRVVIASIVARGPTEQTEVIGLRNDGAGLTVSRGAQYWTDSKGVSHRETYYDLNMKVVMQSCGQGGFYTVRPDGAKVDANGYVIIAANYVNYPKCSVVQTSLGPAKVYDTGGFALRHPTGFDLATDWTRADGI